MDPEDRARAFLFYAFGIATIIATLGYVIRGY